jgi:anti-sigma factor RsiW
MNCRDLDTQLTPYLDGELIAEARVEFEAHIASCATCPRKVEVERHNLSVIREAVREASPAASPAFKTKLFENIAIDASRQQRAGIYRFAAMAAGVTFAVFLGHHGYRAHQRHLYEQDAALRHARQFPLEILQREGIESWFGGKLDHPVNLPRFPNATATGARLLQVRDKPAAYIRYDSPRPMGLFVFGDDHDMDVGTEAEVGSSHGYNVVSWREGDVVYQLVTDLDERDIRDLMPAAGSELDQTPTQLPARPEARPASLQQ